MKQNCWQFKSCGREPGGDRVDELGVCPTAVDCDSHGLNGGVNAGRLCWAVSGHFSDGEIQCAKARDLITCMACDFFQQVMREEGLYNIVLVRPDQKQQRRVPVPVELTGRRR